MGYSPWGHKEWVRTERLSTALHKLYTRRPTSRLWTGTSCQISSIIRLKCTINAMPLNHPQTTPSSLVPEKIVFREICAVTCYPILWLNHSFLVHYPKKKKFNLCLVFTVVYDAAVIIILCTFFNISVKVSLEETPPCGVLAPSSFSHVVQFLFEEVRHSQLYQGCISFPVFPHPHQPIG